MTDWKAAGRAPREVEDELWKRFKAAQDAFFTARNAHFSVQDEELRGNQKVKEEILAEAETIDPAQGLDKAKARLRQLQDRWEAAGKVPRDVMRSLEDRMGAVEEKIRNAGEQRFEASDESPFAAKLREKVVELEVKLEKARAAGRPTDELEAALATQKQWLAQAGGLGSTAAARRRPGPGQPKSTSGWVRAEEEVRRRHGRSRPAPPAARAVPRLDDLGAQEVDRARPGQLRRPPRSRCRACWCRCGRRGRRRRSGTPPRRRTRCGSARPGPCASSAG